MPPQKIFLKERIKRGLRLFLIITIITLIIILLLTIKKETWGSFKKLKAQYFLIIGALWMIYILFDGLRLMTLVNSLGGRINLKASIDVILAGIFLAAVTPFQLGGFPLQLYILNKKSLSLGKGSLALISRGILTGVLLSTIFPFIIVYYRNYFTRGPIRVLFGYLSVVYIIFITSFVLFLVFPARLKRFFSFLKKYRWLGRFYDKFFYEVYEMRSGFGNFFTTQKAMLLVAFLYTIVSMGAYYLMPFFIITGLGVDAPFINVTVLQIIIHCLLMFIPTPGASGVAEGGFTFLYKGICPLELLGIYTLIWRFFTFYLGAAIGGIFIVKLLKTKEIL